MKRNTHQDDQHHINKKTKNNGGSIIDLPYEMRLNILEFLEFSLSRYLIVSEFDKHLEKEIQCHDDLSSKEKAWDFTLKIVRRRLMKLLFGYFSGGSDCRSRNVYLLYRHLNFEESGIPGQHEYYTEFRFRDVNSIIYPDNYATTCKYFDFKRYLPGLEVVRGLNVEEESDSENFLAHDNTRMKSISFGYCKNIPIPNSIGIEQFFSKLVNLTSLELKSANIDEDFVSGLTKNVKHLRRANFRYCNSISLGSIQNLLEEMEEMDELNISYIDNSIILDNVFCKVKKPIKLVKFYASGHKIESQFFKNTVKSAEYLKNLHELAISPYDLNDEEEYKNFFNAFTQLRCLDLGEQTLSQGMLDHINILTELRTLHSNFSKKASVSMLNELPLFTSLTIPCYEENNMVDLSILDNLESLQIQAYYHSLLPYFERGGFTNLQRIQLDIVTEVDFHIQQILKIGALRPRLKISLYIVQKLDIELFEKLLSCEGIENLVIDFSGPVPASIGSNRSLISLSIQNATLDNLQVLCNSRTLEELNIYARRLDVTYATEVCNLFRKSGTSKISLVDPTIVGV